MAYIKNLDQKIFSGKIAFFTKDIRELIALRDNNCCILCKSGYMIDYHHVLFGDETIRNEDRNTPKNGVCVCRDCHDEIHGTRAGKGKRQECIDYTSNIYY